MKKVHIGTSGFYYDHWIGRCYWEGISKRKRLPLYAKKISTVEINSTFYPMREKVEDNQPYESASA